MLFWALLASGQINMRKVDGWTTLYLFSMHLTVTQERMIILF
jgi:hypothetical protein